MLFMVIERFKNRDAAPVYRRFRERGRMAPDGLKYINSWVEPNFDRCFQLMECDNKELFQKWIANWNDLVDFEIVEVMTSQQASALFAERQSLNLDHQYNYWNTAGAEKSFQHPVNLERVGQWLTKDSRVLDYGCGYGRCLGELFRAGFRNLIGFDFSPAMITAARARFPEISFEVVQSSTIPLADASVDGALLFSVLTCMPTDDGQRALIAELRRVLRPGGLLYISDLWLQTDERNLTRYARDEKKYGTYGVFDLPEGVTVRHHDPKWIETLTSDFEMLALDHIDVVTMNGNPANAFQWFGSRTI